MDAFKSPFGATPQISYHQQLLRIQSRCSHKKVLQGHYLHLIANIKFSAYMPNMGVKAIGSHVHSSQASVKVHCTTLHRRNYCFRQLRCIKMRINFSRALPSNVSLTLRLKSNIKCK